MTMDYPDIAPSISYGSSNKKTYRVLSAGFGDGYSQRTPDGLNTIGEVWSMQWNTLTIDEKNILMDFFDSTQGSEAFNMAAPGEDEIKKWVVSEPQVTPDNASYYEVTATFTRVYDL